MAFFQRVVNYLLNEVLVNALANSKTFQHFAIRSNAAITDLAKKTAQQHSTVTQRSSEFLTTFREEMKKGLEDVARKGRP